jgi:hypothetical protein
MELTRIMRAVITPERQLVLRWHDHERARRVVGALMTDGTEQQTGEAASPPGPDDQQFGAYRFA